MIKYKTPFKLKPLIAGNNLAYQVALNTVGHVRACTLHNATGASVEVSVYILPENIAEVDSTHQVVKKVLSSGESYLCPELANHNLQAGDKVFFVGEGVNAMLSVMEQNA